MKKIINILICIIVFVLSFFIGTYLGASAYDRMHPQEPKPLVINTKRANIRKVTVYEPNGVISTEIEADMQMLIDRNTVIFTMKE